MTEMSELARPQVPVDVPYSISPKTSGLNLTNTPNAASPLRSGFKVNALGDGAQSEQNLGLKRVGSQTVRFQSATPIAPASNGSRNFELQQPPKGKRKGGDYFSTKHTDTKTRDQRHGSEPAINGLSRKRTNQSGTQTPPERRSVQFDRSAGMDGSPDHATTKATTAEAEDRQASLFARLKAFATPVAQQGHARHASSAASTLGTPFMTPASELGEPRYPHSNQDGSEAEADAEESSEGEANGSSVVKPKKKRKNQGQSGVPTTTSIPRTPRFSSFLRESSRTPDASSEQRPNFFARRATMGDIPENGRAGVSEDEGRDRLAKSAWKRGIEGARGLSYQTRRNRDSETPEGARPTALRRLTGRGGTFDGSGSPFRARADRNNSSGVRAWGKVRDKFFNPNKRERFKVDYEKSAELMAELLAGSPAALFLASMYQRDEHGRQKIPVLLEQLKIKIPTSETREDKSGDRHPVFTINLEYGNGPSRMEWTIKRGLRDFYNLHIKYKVQTQTERYIQLKGENKARGKIPRFPRSAFPYFRSARGLSGLIDDDDEDEEDENPGDNSAPDGTASGTDRPSNKKRRQSSVHQRRSSYGNRPENGITGSAIASAGMAAGGVGGMNQSGLEAFPERQRRKLEIYLQQMIRWLIFRPDSNRLCKFLELSALAMRLSVEGGLHGKEGLLTITSSRNIQRGGLVALKALPNRIKTIPDRHKPKWFLIRHSYIVAVDSPESLVPIEVFLVDSDFSTDQRKKPLRDQSTKEIAKTATASAGPQHHLLRLYNSERKLRLLAKNERQLMQFKESVEEMQRKTIWSQKHRFDSFAPIRKGVFARWLVDGRDHMWQVSRAIDNARNFIYIHDWWLSPELYLRRPAAISQKWRLDRLLLRKAQEGVKIFVIVYRNIESAIPIDSEYTKAALLDLHPNVCIQRSPNQFRQNQFFWAHHEKLVVIDNAMAFVGGVDLCFGRWDDPSHSVVDDKLTGFELDMDQPRTSDNCQMWPGKDYSNPRVQDFYALDRPYEEMYDRTKVPRMPWHDIAMTIVGQPARDIGRHFVQRWNYILRQRTPTRPTPVLLPPPDFEEGELEKLGMKGTCQIQIVRSCTTWSIGTPNKTECSIMNAYVTLIQQSEHFVYIENQFFISSCTVEGTTINNKIGDALVERIVRAHEQGDNWRACLIIPLMPGFQNSVDSQDGTSVRLIMQCQFRSICRGETSIFARLRAGGIEPTDYIEFYALRQWGKIGPRKSLTTEQLYIHAKCMIVDDRSAIIGSANINERSMLGSRDSEVAAVITDQEMLPSFMGGEPYQVGTFPHTLRMRLMREHLGIDVDEYYREGRDQEDQKSVDAQMEHIYREQLSTPPSTDHDHGLTENNLATTIHAHGGPEENRDTLREWIDSSGQEALGDDGLAHVTSGERVKKSFSEQHNLDVVGYGTDNMKQLADAGVIGGRETYLNAQAREVLPTSETSREGHRHHSTHRDKEVTRAVDHEEARSSLTPPWNLPHRTTQQLGLTQLSQLPALPTLDDTDIGGPPLLARQFSKTSASQINPLLQSMRRPIVTDDCMQDPLVNSFYNDIWHQVAENNTKLYRQVFRCMPDSEVTSWREYREFNSYNERFMQSQGLGTSKPKATKDAPSTSGPPGSQGTEVFSGIPSVAAAAGKLGNGTTKAHGRLSGLSGLLHRPNSNQSSSTHDPDMSEKPQGEQAPLTSDGTGPEDEMDEKTAQRLAEDGPAPAEVTRTRTVQYAPGTNDPNNAPETTATQSNAGPNDAGIGRATSQKRRRRATTKSSGRPHFTSPDDVLTKDEAEELLKLVQGALVVWPYDWLEKEEKGGNWLYNIDQIAPLEIYD